MNSVRQAIRATENYPPGSASSHGFIMGQQFILDWHNIRNVGNSDGQDVALQNEAWIKSVGECRLNLRQGNGNQGVRQAGDLTFECVLTPDGWRSVEELLEPFCESDKAGFQWLTHEGHVALLISPNGQW